MQGVTTLKQQLGEVGRIRLGDERKDQHKPGAPLDHFRVTVAEHDRPILEDVVSVYGGTIEPWRDGDGSKAWQAILAADTIDVAIPPDDSALSIYYEQWKGGYCVTRCNSVRCQRPVGKGDAAHWEEGPCRCDPEEPLCGLVTRLNVILLGVPAYGYFRLDTGSRYAATHFPAVVAMAQRMAQAGNPVPATLTIQAKTTRNLGRPTPKQNFKIPVLRLAVGLTKDALIGGASTVLIEGPKPDPETGEIIEAQTHDPEGPPAGDAGAGAGAASGDPKSKAGGLDAHDSSESRLDASPAEEAGGSAPAPASESVPGWAKGTFGEASGRQRQSLWEWRRDHGATQMGAPRLCQEFGLTPDELNAKPLSELLEVRG